VAKLRTKAKKPRKSAKATTPDHAIATSKKAIGADGEKIACCNEHMTAMKECASWAAAADVQSAANGWAQTNTALSSNVDTIEGLREQLATAVGNQRTLRLKWLAGRKHTIGAVNVFCAGSAQLVEAFGFDEYVKAPADVTITVPGDIITSPGASPGEVDVAWDGVDRHGFMLQWAADPANPATFSQVIPCTVPNFTLTGQTSAATLHFRIAAIDPSQPGHMTAFSGWVAGTVH